MEHADFKIGMTFWCDDRPWRCTDIGTRTIIAIRIDEAAIETPNEETGALSKCNLSYAEAQADNWFNGPPYGIPESVFDEDDLAGCSLEPDFPA